MLITYASSLPAGTPGAIQIRGFGNASTSFAAIPHAGSDSLGNVSFAVGGGTVTLQSSVGTGNMGLPNDGSIFGLPPGSLFTGISNENAYNDLVTPVRVIGVLNWTTVNPVANPSGGPEGGQAVNFDCELVIGDNSPSYTYGYLSCAYHNLGYSGKGTVTDYEGVECQVTNDGSGTISFGCSVAAEVINNSGTWVEAVALLGSLSCYTGNIITGYGALIETPFGTGSLITNNYGVYIQDQSGAGTANSYNLYSAGSTAKHKIEGTLQAVGNASFGLAGTTTGVLALCNAANTNLLKLQAGSTSPGYTLTLPTSGGSNGQVMTTNGSGVTSWTTPTVTLPATPSGSLQMAGFGSSSTSFAVVPGWSSDSIGQVTGTAQGIADVPLTLVTATSPTGTDYLLQMKSGGSTIAGFTNAGGLYASNASNSLTLTFLGDPALKTGFSSFNGIIVYTNKFGLQSQNWYMTNDGAGVSQAQMSGTGLIGWSATTASSTFDTWFSRITGSGVGVNRLATSSGNNSTLTITPPADTGQTANNPQFVVNGRVGTWSGGGTIAQLVSNSFGQDTISGSATATTVTNAYGTVFNAPVAGNASMTLTNAWALGCAGNASIGGVIQIGSSTTGAGTALLSTNCPATTATAPYTWMTFKSSDGSTVYVPAWK